MRLAGQRATTGGEIVITAQRFRTQEANRRDALERLLLQVTRRNDARGYERFKDLFEAIVAYNE